MVVFPRDDKEVLSKLRDAVLKYEEGSMNKAAFISLVKMLLWKH
jgi:hypothetical protein